MRASLLLVLCVLASIAVQATVALDISICSGNNINQCQTICDNNRTPVPCGDRNIACLPNNAGPDDTCCGCRGTACTSCPSSDFCLRSPDASSGWECSRFSLAPRPPSQTSLVRLRGMQCALATNDIVLLPTFAGAQQEYVTAAQNCLAAKFTANDGRSNEQAMRFDCQPPESYRRLCTDNKGSLCEVQGYMANWHLFPAGALIANFTTTVCVPNDCRDISFEPTIQDFFNTTAAVSFCSNSTLSSICTTEVRCIAPPAGPVAADTQLAKNNEYNAGIIALLVVIAVAVVAGIVLVVIFSKKS